MWTKTNASFQVETLLTFNTQSVDVSREISQACVIIAWSLYEIAIDGQRICETNTSNCVVSTVPGYDQTPFFDF